MTNFTSQLKPHPDAVPVRLRWLVWLNIAVQFAFPMAVTFTPAIAGAGGQYFLNAPTKQVMPQTRLYILCESETVAMVAKKYNMSLEQLRKLNQFRTFAHGFDHLKPGDELDVPQAPLPEVQWDDQATGEESADVKDNPAHKVASIASQAGGFLANNPNGDAATSMARGMASGAASGEVQQWLSRFGTARVQLDADENFSLKNSHLELLVPLYDQGSNLVFTQGRLHRTDDRTQANLGFGMRYLTPAYTLGGNVFGDYDLSRGHARAGLGLEYWRDYLRLSANSYMRVTGWKDSPDITDYQERPTNGWDIRANAWLPSLPQLGGKLTFEQYYGKEVALFGVDKRQNNPRAITAGVNYTPVPLITLNAERRQGQSGTSEHRFGVDMNYQLGVPWRSHINPNAVAALRSLAGSRYDLVERNNNIVLEYRKKEVIRLNLNNLIKGYAGEKKSLGVNVTTKYDLDRIEWTSPSLIAAGGKIIQEGAGYFVVIPNYSSATSGINNHKISAVAIDKKGNISAQKETQVTVTQAAIEYKNSTFTPGEVTLPADGKSQKELTLKVNDGNGNPIDIDSNEISVDIKGGHTSTLADFKRKAIGEYTVILTSGIVPESFSITPLTREVELPSAKITIAADNENAVIDNVEVITNNSKADGESENRIKVTVIDPHGNKVPNQKINIKSTGNVNVKESVDSDDNGEAVLSITSKEAGDSKVTVSLSNNASKDAVVTFIADDNTAGLLDDNFTILPEVSVADGKTVKHVRVLVTDNNKNPVKNVSVTFSAGNNAILASKTVSTDLEGVASTTLTNINAGTIKVTATVNSHEHTKDTVFTADTVTAKVISVLPSKSSGNADGKSPLVFTALIKDEFNNPLAGVPVDWKSNRDSDIVKISALQSITNENGEAVTEITSSKALSVVITALTNSSFKNADPVSFVADATKGLITHLTTDKTSISADGTESATISATVQDVNGNPLNGITVTMNSDNNAIISPESTVTNSEGLAVSTLKTKHAGKINIQARLDNGEKKTIVLSSTADAKTALVTLKINKPEIQVGSTPVEMTAKVVDSNNNPLVGTNVMWRSDSNELNTYMSLTNEEGMASAKISGTQARVTSVTAEIFNGIKASSKITFLAGDADKDYSQLSVKPQSIFANGVDNSVAELILKDRWGNPVDVESIKWSAENDSIKIIESDKGSGIYRASVKGNKEGTWLITANSGNVNLQTPLGLIANEKDATFESVNVEGSGTVKADGKTTVKIRAQISDSNGNKKLPGVSIGWKTNLGVLSSPISKTNDDGIAEISLSSSIIGQATVVALLGGGQNMSADKAITFTADEISEDKSSLNLSPATIVAGKDTAIATIVARDINGNLISGLQNDISLVFSTDLPLTTTPFTETENGVYQARITGTKAGKTEVKGQIKNVTIKSRANITVKSDTLSVGLIGEIAVSALSTAVGGNVTYTAMLTDKNGNPIESGFPVTWSANEGSILSSQVSTTDNDGKVVVNLVRNKAGTAKVDLLLATTSVSAPDVSFTADVPDADHSELTLTPSTIIAGKESAVLALTLRDKYDNLLSGQDVIGVSDNNAIIPGKANSTRPGHYQFEVTSKKSGTGNLTVKVNQTTFGQNKVLTVKGDVSNWNISNITTDRTSFTAGDEKGVTYKATVTDSLGNVLPNVVVSWNLTGKAESFTPTSRSDSNGIVSVTIKSSTSGQLLMTAYLDEKHYSRAGVVIVNPGDIDSKSSSFAADKTLITVDTNSSVTFTVTLKDRYGNPVNSAPVKIRVTGSSTDFKLTSVTNVSEGIYHATGKSSVRGKYELEASVSGTVIDKKITITVDSVTPDLKFDNRDQTVTYAKTFKDSQSVNGMPAALKPTWSSSDPKVATVDSTGKVTLLKSGQTKIVVFTAGNEFYNSATASYNLIVNKANPMIDSVTKKITAVWNDKKDQRIVASFLNPDVGNTLAFKFSSSDTAVATVDKSGSITPVKPGYAAFKVNTEETDQFLPGVLEISYTLEKAKVDLSGSKQESFDLISANSVDISHLSIPDESAPYLDVYSSNESVAKWDGALIRFITPGKATLSFGAKVNDYFEFYNSFNYELTLKGATISSLNVKGFRFQADQGFPATGIDGANFKLELTGGAVSDFDWKSDTSWSTVSADGTVKFNDGGQSGQKVTIQGVSKKNPDYILSYSFTLAHWFYIPGRIEDVAPNMFYHAVSKQQCISSSGSLSAVELIYLDKGNRRVGALYSEWGDVSAYNSNLHSNDVYWAIENIGERYKTFSLSRYADTNAYAHEEKWTLCRR